MTEPRADAMTTPDISVVVCSYNGASSIAATLESLSAQRLDPTRFEVIVVDDGSTDGTAAVAEASGARVVRQENSGLAAARNAGVAAARAGIVAFTDDDCEPRPDWLEGLLAAFDDPAVLGASGPVESAADDTLVLRYIVERRPLAPLPARLLRSSNVAYRLLLYLRGVARIDDPLVHGSELYSVVGANMAFRVQALRDAGGFDPVFRFGGEEEELSGRVHALPGSGSLVYAANATVVHHFEPDLADTLRRARAYGKGNARTAAKHEGVRLIVYPFPLAVGLIAVAAIARRSPRLLLLAGAAPAMTYFGWTSMAIRQRRPEALIYAYLQLAEEVATMTGEVMGYRDGYDPPA